VLGRTLGDSGIREAGAKLLAIRKRSGQFRINPPADQVLESDLLGGHRDAPADERRRAAALSSARMFGARA
jgi:hypothetical protein